MMIYLAIIPSINLANVKEMAEQLEAAVEAGHMAKVDALTEALVALSDQTSAVVLTHEQWQQFLDAMGEAIGGFPVSYVLTVTSLRPALGTGDSGIHATIALLTQAIEKDCSILQLPWEEVG